MPNLKGSVDNSINHWLTLPGYEKLNVWTYWARVALTVSADLAPPYALFSTNGVGVSNIQRANTFAPNPEKFILTSISGGLYTPNDTVDLATAATVALLANAQRIVKTNLKLTIQASQGVNVLDLPLTAIPAGPEPMGFISAGGVVTNSAGVQEGYPFYYPFEKETTSVVQLELCSTAATTTMTLGALTSLFYEVRFHGIRLRTNQK